MKFNSVAVFIDAENFPHTLVDEAIEKIANLGAIGKIFAYGDFSNPSLRKYKFAVQKYNITAVQIFSRTSGKNSADIALAMDAVELANARKHDAFAIVSSDSDFNRLAQKLRDGGAGVIGVAKDDKNAGVYDEVIVVKKAAQESEGVATKISNEERAQILKAHEADESEGGGILKNLMRLVRGKSAKKEAACEQILALQTPTPSADGSLKPKRGAKKAKILEVAADADRVKTESEAKNLAVGEERNTKKPARKSRKKSDENLAKNLENSSVIKAQNLDEKPQRNGAKKTAGRAKNSGKILPADANGNVSETFAVKPLKTSDVHEILRNFWLENRRVSPDGFIHCSLFGSALRSGEIKIALKELGFSRLGKLFDALEKEGFIEQIMDGSAPKFRVKETV